MPSGSINGHGREEDSSEPVAIVAFGNALLDMSISVKDDSLIQKYGLPCDAQIEVTNEQQGLFSEVIQNYPVEYVAGGSAQNTVRILCRLIKNQWPSYVIGKIAHDPAGIILQKLLAQDGVRTRYVFDEKLPTGCCVAIVRPGGTRCLAANIGAAREFNKENFVADMMDLIDRARILYVEGFFASHSPDVAMAALSRGHSRGGSTEAWDWSKLNERLAVVTCGASGVVCATRSESWLFPAEKLQPHLVKDTTGAGDAFLAGFFSQLLVGRPLDVCVATGQQTARIVITQTGCRLPV
ncbi:hypothetical protein DAPPUDRAFT_100541 [Daphnia pulex]|uniref:Adenosine kinase n=1 Tax=Daphnia pulex TaxID=6669 RepID=E9GAN8_DAPPU|nr:hypothetical protein DAPPUDRAFT_100541 [Daphnia pulex]|eukprot:EFX83287.1 hypothetical protein DAPPUDRAFT_100541 [Daphnia pulex]